MHIAAAAVGLVLLAAGPSQAAGLVTQWRAALEGCLAIVETGGPDGLDSAVWTPEATGAASTFRHETGVMISATLPVIRGDGVVDACGLSFGSKIPGNDRRGQVLREALAALAEGRLSFREQDQILPPDVYRGCAWDGREFRLWSMTQTTHAQFAIQLSPRDRACTAATS